MENGIRERIRRIIGIENLSIKAFSEKTNVPRPTIVNMFAKDTKPSYDFIKSIAVAFPTYSLGWLITGEGSMLKSEVVSTISEPEKQSPEENNAVNYRLVPLLNLDAVGGMHSLNSESGDSEYIDKLIPFTDAQDGDVALIISGESMSPTCPSGSKVLIREVPRWNEYFGYGNIFVLLLTDGRRILKEVQKWHEDSKNYILCRSHNDKYPEEELPKSMIAGVWKVIKILNERGW